MDWQNVHGSDAVGAWPCRVRGWRSCCDQFDGSATRSTSPTPSAGCPTKRRYEVLKALDDDRLADILQELPEQDQADVLSQLGTDRAADVLEEMDPDDAADLLGVLNPSDAEVLADAGWIPRIPTRCAGC